MITMQILILQRFNFCFGNTIPLSGEFPEDCYLFISMTVRKTVYCSHTLLSGCTQGGHVLGCFDRTMNCYLGDIWRICMGFCMGCISLETVSKVCGSIIGVWEYLPHVYGTIIQDWDYKPHVCGRLSRRWFSLPTNCGTITWDWDYKPHACGRISRRWFSLPTACGTLSRRWFSLPTNCGTITQVRE
jgi:hypothetical protein